jgi:hypothetical protein
MAYRRNIVAAILFFVAVGTIVGCGDDDNNPAALPAGGDTSVLTGNTLLGVSFTDANTGTAVGYYGTILHTTDGGVTWVPQSSGTVEILSGASFTDANAGAAVTGGMYLVK